jgi:hypothetical protein
MLLGNLLARTCSPCRSIATERHGLQARASGTATITVSGSGINRTIAVTQDPAPALTVSASSLDFASAGSTRTLDVSSNTTWTAVSSASWATVSTVYGNGDETLTVTVTTNSGASPRTATLTISGSGISRTVNITQTGTPVLPAYLTIDTSSLQFATAGGYYNVTVASNREWTAVSEASWLTVTPSANDFRIDVANNTGYERTDSVTVTAGDVTQMVYVTQDAAQQIIAEPKPPVDNRGSIEIALEIPVSEQFNITFTVTLPEGFLLDEQATSLVSELINSYRLSVTPNGLGGWLFEISPAIALRSGSETSYREIVNIVYTIQETVLKGDYEVKIDDVDLTMESSGEVVHQDEISVPVRIGDDVSNALVGATEIFYSNGILTVSTPTAEQITVYSAGGAAVYQSKKAEGLAAFHLGHLSRGVYIARGSSGWTVKFIR